MAFDLENLQRAAARDPAQLVRLCDALVAEGRAEDAVAACRRGLEGRPDDIALKLALGRALSAAGHLDEAHEVMLEATRRGPQNGGRKRAAESGPSRAASAGASAGEQRLMQIALALRGGKSSGWDVDDPIPEVRPDPLSALFDRMRSSSIVALWVGLAIFILAGIGGYWFRNTSRAHKIGIAIEDSDSRAATALFEEELLAQQTYASILRTNARRRDFFAMVAQASARLAADHGQDTGATAWAMLRRAEKEAQKGAPPPDPRAERELTAARALLALQRGEPCPTLDDSFGDIAARCSQQRGDLDAARKILSKQIETTAGADLRALLYLGSLELGAGDLDAAEAAYSKVLARSPNHPRAQVGKAMVALERGEIPKLQLPQDVKLGPVTEAWFHLAGALRAFARGKEGDDSLAQRELEQTRKAIPHDGRLALLYGRAQLLQGRVAEAEQAMRVAQHLNPNDGDGMVLDAEVALAKGFEDKVLTALAVGAPTPRKLAVLGRAQCLVGKYKEAIVTLDAALKRRPGDATAFTYRAIAQAHLGDPSGATRELERAVTKLSSTTPRYGLGLLAFQRHDLNRAKNELSRAMERNPESFRARALLGQVYRDLGQTKEAVAELERVAREAPALLTVHQTLGQLYLDLGREREARAEFRVVMDGGKASVNDRVAYIELLSSLGYVEEAKKLIEAETDKATLARLERSRFTLQSWAGGRDAIAAAKGLERLRRGAGAKDTRLALLTANAYRRAGEVRQAETLFRAVAGSDPLHAHLGLGKLALGRNAWEPAESEYRSALLAWEQGPYGIDDQTEARIGLGRALLGRKAVAEAVATLTPCLQDDPNSPEARYFLARAYHANGEKDKARAQSEKAVALDDHYKEAVQFLAQLKGTGSPPSKK